MARVVIRRGHSRDLQEAVGTGIFLQPFGGGSKTVSEAALRGLKKRREDH